MCLVRNYSSIFRGFYKANDTTTPGRGRAFLWKSGLFWKSSAGLFEKLRSGQGSNFCRGNTVTRGVFNQVHGLVGQMQKLDFALLCIGRIRGHSDACREVNVQPFGVEPGGFADQCDGAVWPPRMRFPWWPAAAQSQTHRLRNEMQNRSCGMPFSPSAPLRREVSEPTRWPCVSLTPLKWSKSMNTERKFIPVALRAVNLRLEYEVHVPRIVQVGAIIRDG